MFPTIRQLLENPVPRPPSPFRSRPPAFRRKQPMRKTTRPGVATFVRRFDPPFADLVRSGAKLQTICPHPRRTPKPGDRLILRTWEGTTQRLLRRATIQSVTPITLPNPEFDDAFAIAEGYRNLKHLLLHLKPGFRGILIRWDPLPRLHSFQPLPPGHPDSIEAPM